MYRVIVWEAQQNQELVITDTYTTVSTVEELLYHYSIDDSSKLQKFPSPELLQGIKGTVLEDNSKYDLNGYSFIDSNKRCTHVWISEPL